MLKGFYALCNQTVTVYRKETDGYTTKVYPNAFLDEKKTYNVEKTGSRESSSFLLVIPGGKQMVFVGDKVIHGRGKAIKTRQEWANLIPAKVPGLCVVSTVDVKRWNGRIVHTEAGG